MSKAALVKKICAGPKQPSVPPPACLLGPKPPNYPPPAHFFDQDAHGCPRDWHRLAVQLGKDNRHLFKVVEGSEVDVHKMWAFLEKRSGPDGEPITKKLEEPVKQGDGWFRLRWLDYQSIWMPQVSLAGGSAEWARAWHGCPIEAVYSIAYHGILMESCDESHGHRFSPESPGVYVHRHELAHKAENYTCFCPLFGDGVFWAAKWELHVDRADKVVPRGKTDQWIQRSRSVRLVALWLCGKTIDQLENGTLVAVKWNPLLEAHPFKDQIMVPKPPSIPPPKQPADPPPAHLLEDLAEQCLSIERFHLISIDFVYRIKSN